MAGQILAFPNVQDSALGVPVWQGALALASSTQTSPRTRAPEKPLGPTLIYARPRAAASRADMTQAEYLNGLLDDEISERVQREAAERHTGRRLTLIGGRRVPASMPTLATAVRFRERLLDALFFFVRWS